MYCSIQDAWPENGFRIENFNQYPELQKPLQQKQQITETMVDKDKCYLIIEHIESCPKCKQYIMQKYGSNRLSELFTNNPELKETVIVFLIGILILLVLNLFYK